MKSRRDPPRLLDESVRTSPFARAVLLAGLDADPTPPELDRLTRRLGPILGPPQPTDGDDAASQATEMGTLRSLGVAHRVAFGIVVAGVAALFWGRFSGGDSSLSTGPSVVASPTAATPPAESSLPMGEARAVEEVPPEAARTRKEAATEAAVSPADTPSAPRRVVAKTAASARATSRRDEVELLERAHRALAQGQPQRALEVTIEHQAMTGAVLVQERERIAIEALVHLGKLEVARARAEQFRRSYPTSGYAPRITTLVDGAHHDDRLFQNR